MKFKIEKRKYNEPLSEQHIIDAESKLGAISAGAKGYVLMKEGNKMTKKGVDRTIDLEEIALKPDHKVKIRSFNSEVRMNTDENTKNYLAGVHKENKERKSANAKNSKTNDPRFEKAKQKQLNRNHIKLHPELLDTELGEKITIEDIIDDSTVE